MARVEVRLRIGVSTVGFRADGETVARLAQAIDGAGIPVVGPGGRVGTVVGARVDETPSSDRALILELELEP